MTQNWKILFGPHLLNRFKSRWRLSILDFKIVNICRHFYTGLFLAKPVLKKIKLSRIFSKTNDSMTDTISPTDTKLYRYLVLHDKK